jgi:hypothetical protein
VLGITVRDLRIKQKQMLIFYVDLGEIGSEAFENCDRIVCFTEELLDI